MKGILLYLDFMKAREYHWRQCEICQKKYELHEVIIEWVQITSWKTTVRVLESSL